MSLTLITGSIDEVEDPFGRLDLSELYYEFWDEDAYNPKLRVVTRDAFPIRFYGLDLFRIVQDLGSGKTLKAMDILSNNIVFAAINGHPNPENTVAANMGLVWHNEGKPKDEWVSIVNTMEDLENLDHCTVVLDDINNIILKWNVKEADVVAHVAGWARKGGLKIIMTAQREKQIPPAIRDMATEWIVPIIRVRDNTRATPDGQTGYPIELISLHFGGSKVFRYISQPLINLEPLFNCYSTLERSASLKDGTNGARPNQPGYDLEVKALEYLKEKVPAMEWQHLNGKSVFDIISDTWAVDVTGMDNDGNLITEHKNLMRHISTANKKGQMPYLMFPYQHTWGFLKINKDMDYRFKGQRIDTHRLRIKKLEDVLK